jgi:hypothetical protein
MPTETELWEALRTAAHAQDEARRAFEVANTTYHEAKGRYELAWREYHLEITRPASEPPQPGDSTP